MKKVLSGIHGRLGLGAGFPICLCVIDDIDFDCRQPFLTRILEELLSNSVTAMQAQVRKRVEVMATQYGRRLCIQVADNGPGMPDTMVQWFEHGQHDALSGGGRHGLEVVSRLVRGKGGRLCLLKTGERGTRLGVSLPLAGDAGAPA